MDSFDLNNLHRSQNNVTSGKLARTVVILTFCPLTTSANYVVTGTESGANPAPAWGFGKNANQDYSYPFLYSSAGADVYTVVQITATPVISYAEFDGSTVQGWLNSQYNISKSTSLNTTPGVWYFGKRQQTGIGSIDSHILEFIQYSRKLSSNERYQIEGYLAWKWGLQTSIPTNHPYYAGLPTAIYLRLYLNLEQKIRLRLFSAPYRLRTVRCGWMRRI
jgi:hypothetical protein